jgi:hypothetical protein
VPDEPEVYSTHQDYIGAVKPEADTRQEAIENALRAAFEGFIESREVDVILFGNMSAEVLAKAMEAHPEVVKTILAASNIAARAIERDLGIKNFGTYEPRFKAGQAAIIAGYVKPHLPPYLAIPALSLLDRWAFIDKEVRKSKGRWEKLICSAANSHDPGGNYRKCKFDVEEESFELDAACKDSQGRILIGIDVKRIEARRDIHKRCDEIINKAAKLKSAHASSKFGVVVYYPFIEEQANILSRLSSPTIDGIMFASATDESVKRAVKMLLDKLKETAP